MRRLVSFFVALISISLIVFTLATLWVIREVNRPAAYTETKEIVIPAGSSGLGVAHILADEQIITQPRLFYILLRLKNLSVKAGEYAFAPHLNLKQVQTILAEGKTIQRAFTLAEGLTVKQALILLRDNPYLQGDITIQPDEGTLLPETYSFTRGDTRDDLIKRMIAAHHALVAELWAKRAADLVLKTPEEAVILASIVEKETGKPEERARIAGVFYNRLKIGMPLQTDPTVVYAVTNKLGHMQGKPLLSKHLAIASRYNTYKHTGLTPGPIANPGRASLEAVLHPEENDYLFFVADGTGGHVFGKTLADHNKNVRAWRAIKKKMNN